MFGASGMVGQGVVLFVCLDAGDVASVSSVRRSRLEVEHDKAHTGPPRRLSRPRIDLGPVVRCRCLFLLPGCVGLGHERGDIQPTKGVFCSRFATTTELVGRAMIRVAREGYAKTVLENRDINALAG